MKSWRILAAATAIELSLGVAVLAAAGLYGLSNGWFDTVNCFAPATLAAAVLAMVLNGRCLPRGKTRSVCMVLALAAILYTGALVAPELLRLIAAPRPVEGPTYRIVTANAYHHNPAPHAAVTDILDRDADAVMVQEADAAISHDIPRLLRKYAGSTLCPRSGVRIFVKTPVIRQGCGLGSGTGSDRDLAWLQTVTPDGRPLWLVTAHLGQPLPPARQAADRQALALRLSLLPKPDLVLGGDFNTPPWTFAMLEQDRLLAPLTRRTLFWFTWPARLNLFERPWATPLLPIDHLYAGSHWRLKRLTRFRVTGSDHFATEAVLARVP